MDIGADRKLQPSKKPGSLPVEVAAGLIFREGRLLITQRYPDSHLGGMWEFPGGKREAGETFRAALVRELREELGVTVVVGELIESVHHAYPGKTVRIDFYRCHLHAGEPAALGCHNLKWVRRSELRQQPFPAADARLLDRLSNDDQFWTWAPAA